MHDGKADMPGRRRFLKGALGASLVGTGCLTIGLESALARAKQDKKPLLSEESLNKFLEKQSKEELQKAVRTFKPKGESLNRKPLEAWLKEHFTLTPYLEEHIDNLPDADRREIDRAADVILERGVTKLRVKFVQLRDGANPGGDGQGEEEQEPALVKIRCKIEIEW